MSGFGPLKIQSILLYRDVQSYIICLFNKINGNTSNRPKAKGGNKAGQGGKYHRLQVYKKNKKIDGTPELDEIIIGLILGDVFVEINQLKMMTI